MIETNIVLIARYSGDTRTVTKKTKSSEARHFITRVLYRRSKHRTMCLLNFGY